MKIAGSILTVLFFTLIGLKIVKYKKAQINFVDDIIYLCELLTLFLKSSMPDTDEIIDRISADERLSAYDFYELSCSSTLSEQSNEYLSELTHLLGKYDVDIQLEKIRTIKIYFDNLCKQLSDKYNKKYKLYFAFSIFTGFLVVILLA